MPRGSDFEARWKEGAWAEAKVLDALNALPEFVAVQYGITDGTPFHSSRLMAARGLPAQSSHGKRPDILIFRKENVTSSDLNQINGLVHVSDDEADEIARKAVIALECEFSPYNYAKRLEEYGKELSYTIKEEDLNPLISWVGYFNTPLAIVQIFLDSAYCLPFSVLISGINDGSIRRIIERSYNKAVYYPKMSHGISFGVFSESPLIIGEVLLDKYGKYTPLRKVEGGKLAISDEMVSLIEACRTRHSP